MPPRKKVDAKEVKPEDVTALSFFQCQELTHEISILAEQNNGELTDDQVNALIEAQTQSPAKLHSLCNFLKLMESNIKICKERKKEINEVQQHAEQIIDRMEARLAIFIENQGKSYHAGEYELTTRKSTSVDLIEGFDNAMFCKVETVRVVTPDKKEIKKALESGEEVPGATLNHKLNLNIK